jgi:hypothetical protein
LLALVKAFESLIEEFQNLISVCVYSLANEEISFSALIVFINFLSDALSEIIFPATLLKSRGVHTVDRLLSMSQISLPCQDLFLRASKG